MSTVTAEEQQKRHTQNKQHTHQPEDVVVGQHRRMTIHHAVKQLEGTVLGDAG